MVRQFGVVTEGVVDALNTLVNEAKLVSKTLQDLMLL